MAEMYRLSIAGVVEDHATLESAVSRARAISPAVSARSGASGGACHHYTTLHVPVVDSPIGHDPIGEQVGIVAWPGYHFLVP